MPEHKIIYALTIRQEPGSKQTYTCPKSGFTYTWIVPEDGSVLFYIGESTMKLHERYSKHKTFAKKLVKHLAGEAVLDPHLYPIYYFTAHFCGPLGQDFDIHLLQDGPGLSENEWIANARAIGHPLMNSADGSYKTKAGERKDDGTLRGEWRRLVEKTKPKKAAEATAEEAYQARLAWIAARKAQQA